MRNIASLILALGIVAGLGSSGLAQDTPKSTKTVKHTTKRHVHKAGVSKSAAPTEGSTETKTETKSETK